MRYNLIVICLLTFFLESYSQEKYITRDGFVEFISETDIETIHPTSNQLSCIFDINKSNIAFQIKMISFRFEKALMEEHFNEKYVESEKFPTSTFIGKLEVLEEGMYRDVSSSDYLDGKDIQVRASGDIKIHGINKHIIAYGSMKSINNMIHLESDFDLLIEDFRINIPSIVRKNISETVNVRLKVELNR